MPPLPQARARQTRAEQRASSRRRVFDALEVLLAHETFPELTVDAITAQAGLSRSTLYAHFPDKATMLLALAEDIFATASDVAAPWWDGPTALSRGDLRARLRSLFDLYGERQAVLRALVDAAGYEPEVKRRLADMHRGYIEHLTAHIRLGQRAGDVRQEVLPEPTASWLVWMLERGLYQLVASAPDPAAVEDLATSCAAIIWHAVYVEPALPSG